MRASSTGRRRESLVDLNYIFEKLGISESGAAGGQGAYRDVRHTTQVARFDSSSGLKNESVRTCFRAVRNQFNVTSNGDYSGVETIHKSRGPCARDVLAPQRSSNHSSTTTDSVTLDPPQREVHCAARYRAARTIPHFTILRREHERIGVSGVILAVPIGRRRVKDRQSE